VVPETNEVYEENFLEKEEGLIGLELSSLL
jgi:hypothetical protein